ncbi:MAG: primosomal protein N' [Verrucomicrobia bacterium]|jgi:primosomal protein N' (replication factor Y) (superfamily II helicase)|nr:primosomal protein N' [Verrucomicrobiota bacterium]
MIARVTLEIALRKEFDYLVPPEFQDRVDIGARVKVPFGGRKLMGVVTGLPDQSDHHKLKPILNVIGKGSLVTPKVLALARWMAAYYCCPIETALKSVLPVAVRKEKEGWKKQLHIRSVEPVGSEIKLTKRQQELRAILQEWKEMPLQEFLKMTQSTKATVKKLEDAGVARMTHEVIERDPYADEHIVPTESLELNQEQRRSLDAIEQALDADPDQRTSSVFLLHGVTGSGKTEVYLQAIDHAMDQGKGAIVLVPEISLTPQTVERFKARFSSGKNKTLVAVLHSHLSDGERHDEWHKIREGRARIVIGARSAVFAPVEPLGLIIVDEEHEHSYKQEEAPRYHARDVAVVRAQREQAVVVLGSATPSLETYYNTQKGKYHLLEMPSRADNKTMPWVRVVDMRSEGRKNKGIPILSQQLKESIQQRLDNREQTMLFLNRRGYASSMQCPKCGFVAGCPNCSISLTYHRRKQQLRCHICGHDEKAPVCCPVDTCKSYEIRFAGIGTEKVEDTLKVLFPKAGIERMDSDTLKRKEDYKRILTDFRLGKVDILIGTQMIAKGLHFPNVTLVGIIYADLSLHMPDFRAGERTFQLLTQVAGRAGRGDVEGDVYVQSFTPFHAAIQYARRHDYLGFYEQEIEFRKETLYPPAMRLAVITLRGKNEEKLKLSGQHLAQLIGQFKESMPDLTVAGPSPAPLERAETFFRYQIMMKCARMSRLSAKLAQLIAETRLPEGVLTAVDIDPVNMH